MPRVWCPAGSFGLSHMYSWNCSTASLKRRDLKYFSPRSQHAAEFLLCICTFNIYLDPDYFKEESRRSQCCVPGGKPLNWDQILQQNSLIPKKLQGPR